MQNSQKHKNPIVLFDGACNLCNKSVQYILEKERGPRLYFASLQSDFGVSLLKEFNFPADYRDSVLLYENDKLWSESGAALKIASYLKAPWSWLRILWIIPNFLRNWLYRFVAKRRIRWFGSAESCWVMQSSWRERFLA
jgi:predicted DCC family thiol-disulfide oxidoreductase YuxK